MDSLCDEAGADLCANLKLASDVETFIFHEGAFGVGNRNILQRALALPAIICKSTSVGCLAVSDGGTVPRKEGRGKKEENERLESMTSFLIHSE
ncbi:hypothetical protein R1flu_020700 [Riccia fluitans]|uniref:Uncharacterized protein n=1 Tax=Riccia fluitans TaxID=41844 RepID=A0ABD1ZMQ1_9MARC